jgi:hypothetical protein
VVTYNSAKSLFCVINIVAALGEGSAFAADLGGDCCADLEERIAELESTTARKGNRKVSLTVSGWVNNALFTWDDGTQFDAYLGTNLVEQSRVKFLGEAKIDKDWSAGYLLEIGIQGHLSSQWNQISDKSLNPNPINQDDRDLVRKSYWFIKSKQLGQIAVGLNGTATYHLLDDADPTMTRNMADAEAAASYMAAFLIRSNGSFVNNLRWPDVLRGFNNSTPGQSARREVVRYDSPEWNGFVLSAAWGEDDIGDVALTYKQNIHDFSVLARAGYGSSNDPGTLRSASATNLYVVGGTPCISSSAVASSLPAFDCRWGGAAATIQHNPTGLYVFGGWGKQTIDTGNAVTDPRLVEPDSSTWFVQPGIEHKWCSLGKTLVFAEYRHDEPGSNPGRTVSANINFAQAGIVQQLEKADMNLYAIYQFANGDVTGNAVTAATGAPIGNTSIDGFQQFITGAKINF